jgi:two-component system, chemotaxis family, protein-glutamate methylesterase/glutaminase
MPSPTADPPPVVAVGASAGGVEALRDFVARLPADFPAAVLVVLHIPATAVSALPMILDRAGAVPVREARDGDRLVAGTVLVAAPDRHLIVLDGRVSLTRGPSENGHRPAVDVLLRTAAHALGPRAAAVVLSGSLDDGAAGALSVARRGGLCVVQDFGEALYDGMPRAAAASVSVGFPPAGLDALRVLPIAEMASVLEEWAASLPPPAETSPEVLLQREAEVAELDAEEMHDPDRPGVPSGFGCPDCAGALFQIDEGGLRRFRCRVGHAWSPESLLGQQSAALESALWMALRSLEEKAALNDDLRDNAARSGHTITAARFGNNAEEARRAAELVRQLVSEIGGGSVED